jgi:hypothetical protein
MSTIKKHICNKKSFDKSVNSFVLYADFDIFNLVILKNLNFTIALKTDDQIYNRKFFGKNVNSFAFLLSGSPISGWLTSVPNFELAL